MPRPALPPATDLLRAALARTIALSLLTCAALPAWALYKVVGPDGSVTYTDRPPPGAAGGRVTSIGAAGQQRDADAAPTPAAATATLPIALRQVATRYPVTIYVTADCAPCEGGRRWLRDRGVPYTESLIETEDDARALERLVGARMVPSLTIGGQALRGINPDEWAAYIDAAGYPRGALPAGWKPAAATPLSGRRATAAPVPAEAPAPLATGGPSSALPAAPAAPAPATPGFRF